ncbi:MAG: hypothetical protein QXJ71_06930 [Pyrobaculum sp.]
MSIQIVDYSEEAHVVEEAAVVVSPRCKCKPPSPHADAFPYIARATREIYGVDISSALSDQLDLGLRRLDVVLLHGQLPLGDSWLARLLPNSQETARCVAPMPDPITAALSILSAGVGNVVVDMRYGYAKYTDIIAEYATATNAKLQLLVTKPLALPGDVIFHSSTPPYLKERYVKAAGEVSITRGFVRLKPLSYIDEDCDISAPDFAKTLERVAQVLDLDMGLLDHVVSQPAVSHTYLQEFATTWQIGYLAKWDLIRQAPGGWTATSKLMYLYGLARGR